MVYPPPPRRSSGLLKDLTNFTQFACPEKALYSRCAIDVSLLAYLAWISSDSQAYLLRENLFHTVKQSLMDHMIP
jgi:hypothetical protein